jgi:hypothetical protein
MSFLRRDFLRRFSLLPLGFGLRSTTVGGSGEEGVQVAPVEIALEVVRLFNTMELHYHLKFGGYASADQLLHTLSASWFTDPRPDIKDPRKRFFSYLRLNDEEIVSGWKMTIAKSDDESGYTLNLIRVTGSMNGKTENTVFVSDEIGVIYLGDSDLDYDPALGPRKAATIPGMEPIDVKLAPRGLANTFRKFAFAALGVQPDNCGCICTCQNTPQCFCGNTGCRSCGWCCAGSCGNCAFCSIYNCSCCTG